MAQQGRSWLAPASEKHATHVYQSNIRRFTEKYLLSWSVFKKQHLFDKEFHRRALRTDSEGPRAERLRSMMRVFKFVAKYFDFSKRRLPPEGRNRFTRKGLRNLYNRHQGNGRRASILPIFKNNSGSLSLLDQRPNRLSIQRASEISRRQSIHDANSARQLCAR